MTLDGYPVEVGDTVFDVAQGPGMVEDIGVGIVVSFKTHSYTYDETGTGPFRRRTLYWANPVPSPPSKDVRVREAMGRMWAAINQTLKEIL